VFATQLSPIAGAISIVAPEEAIKVIPRHGNQPPPYAYLVVLTVGAMDSLAVLYARELSRWGIETTIVVPGAFTKGTKHFAHSGRPADKARVADEAGPYKGFGEEVLKAAIVPDDAEPSGVADEIVKVVDMPFGKRPFRIHYDPTEDGANVGFTVLDRRPADFVSPPKSPDRRYLEPRRRHRAREAAPAILA
jgi:hypothetical protein